MSSCGDKNMPTVNITSDCLRAMKQYLVDFDDYDQDDFLADCVSFCMEHVDEFEDYAEEEEEEEAAWEAPEE